VECRLLIGAAFHFSRSPDDTFSTRLDPALPVYQSFQQEDYNLETDADAYFNSLDVSVA
jgi:hypothetical protein